MTQADFIDYHQNGTLVPANFDIFVFCPFCGLFDGGVGDSCALIAGLHPEYETMAASSHAVEDFSEPMLRGWDFIAYYGQPISSGEELARHLPERRN